MRGLSILELLNLIAIYEPSSTRVESERRNEKKSRSKGRSWHAPAFRKPFERPTFESDWVMHVLFFLVPTYVN